jgi:hypothetical protein
MNKNIPDLTFFCEMPSDKLKAFFSNSDILKQLKELHANISLGLLDFSPERAAVVKQLTKSGIPVTAWLLLPKDKGYWTSLDTVSQTVRAYADFKSWTIKNNLKWAAVGLDIEPSINRMGLFGKGWINEIPDLAKRLFSARKYTLLENELRALINQIRLDGFPVETYNFPFIIDERKADSRILARTLGIPPLNVDREVLMLYSSSFSKNGDAILWSYAHQAEGIGLGSTGGGVELENGEPMRSMSWSDLQRDIRIAREFSQHIYIFSLEGCVQQHFLEPLIHFNWEVKSEFPVKTGQKVTLVRHFAQVLLWLASHPQEILMSIFFLNLFRHRKK